MQHGDGFIILSSFEVADAPMLFEADTDPEHRRRFDFPHDFRPSIRHAEEVIARWENERVNGIRFVYAVRNATTGQVLGGVELLPLGDGTANLSYWTHPLQRRQGIASRAASLACRIAFRDLGFRTVRVLVDADNTASRRVALAARFLEAGIQYGRVCFILHSTHNPQ